MRFLQRLSPKAVLTSLLCLPAVPWYGHAQAAQIRLTWTDNSTTEAGFKIERKIGTDGPFVQVAIQKADHAFYTDSDVVVGTTYCYRVRAFNETDESAYSEEVCGTAGKARPSRASRAAPAKAAAVQSLPPESSDDPRTRRGRKRVPGGWVQRVEPTR
jgi:hypothetical protein